MEFLTQNNNVVYKANQVQ